MGMCLTGPLAALSPISMVTNSLGGKGLLGKKKKNGSLPSPAMPETTQGTPGPSPSYYGA